MKDGKRRIIEICQALATRQWVANHDGNVTIRMNGDRFQITPTATAKADVRETDLLEVDGTGKRLSGRTKAFGELSNHLAVYKVRPDVGAVIHAHPPHATAIAVSGKNVIEQPFIAEAIVSLGDSIPLLPFAAPGAPTAEQLSAVAPRVDAVLLEGHGVFTWGKDLEQAYLRMELVEHLARIALASLPLGGPQALPAPLVAKLLEKRRSAGLGMAADHTSPRRPTNETEDLAVIVGQEIAKALGS